MAPLLSRSSRRKPGPMPRPHVPPALATQARCMDPGFRRDERSGGITGLRKINAAPSYAPRTPQICATPPPCSLSTPAPASATSPPGSLPNPPTTSYPLRPRCRSALPPPTRWRKGVAPSSSRSSRRKPGSMPRPRIPSAPVTQAGCLDPGLRRGERKEWGNRLARPHRHAHYALRTTHHALTPTPPTHLQAAASATRRPVHHTRIPQTFPGCAAALFLTSHPTAHPLTPDP